MKRSLLMMFLFFSIICNPLPAFAKKCLPPPDESKLDMIDISADDAVIPDGDDQTQEYKESRLEVGNLDTENNPSIPDLTAQVEDDAVIPDGDDQTQEYKESRLEVGNLDTENNPSIPDLTAQVEDDAHIPLSDEIASKPPKEEKSSSPIRLVFPKETRTAATTSLSQKVTIDSPTSYLIYPSEQRKNLLVEASGLAIELSDLTGKVLAKSSNGVLMTPIAGGQKMIVKLSPLGKKTTSTLKITLSN